MPTGCKKNTANPRQEARKRNNGYPCPSNASPPTTTTLPLNRRRPRASPTRTPAPAPPPHLVYQIGILYRFAYFHRSVIKMRQSKMLRS